jgi:ribonucleoside-triphosphate reductase
MSARAHAIYQRTYSRPLDSGGSETFEQTVDRVTAHQRWLWLRALGVPEEDHGDPSASLWFDEQHALELTALRKLFLDRKCAPAGRTMWLGGTEVARTREISMFNCTGAKAKTVYDLVDLFWQLLNGCGTGARPELGCLYGFARPIPRVSVVRSQRKLGEPGGHDQNRETWDPATRTWSITVGDSGEAWAKALGKLVAGKFAANHLVLDLSQIRAEGSLLSRYGWRSSGDTVIASEFPKIVAVLNRRAGQLLRKVDICDIINHLGVIQTGRRGAEILLVNHVDPEAEDFITFKRDCYSDPARYHRQQSNNSLLFWEQPPRAELERIFGLILSSGGNEPGFINAAEARRRAPWFDTVNPCVEILLADGGICNLVETDVSKFSYLGDLCEALRLVARANYRQTCVNLRDGILQGKWHENNESLRLCGVSLTGIAGRPDLTAHDYRQLRIAAQAGAWSMADELGLPRPKNVTCVKPSGTMSKVMDAPGEGAHKPLGRYVFNSVVYARTDPLVARFADAGYEVRPHPTQGTQVLVKFPVENAGVAFDDFHGTPVNLEPAVAQLERYRLLMDNWCDQNVSLTVSYDPGEVPAIIDWLERHWNSYVGVSWAFRTDPTKTAADFGAAYLPQEVVTREVFEAYATQLRPADLSGDVGGALDLVTLQEQAGEECEAGVCPVR